MDVAVVLWWIMYATTLYMKNLFFCWIMLDLLAKDNLITDEKTVWPLSLFLCTYDL